ncbi:MAG: hypothetical protein KKH88_04325 [Nanoarchaeota archaeon]|nr:hypothetical protein [Nanoarchaeota archaeon]
MNGIIKDILALPPKAKALIAITNAVLIGMVAWVIKDSGGFISPMEIYRDKVETVLAYEQARESSNELERGLWVADNYAEGDSLSIVTLDPSGISQINPEYYGGIWTESIMPETAIGFDNNEIIHVSLETFFYPLGDGNYSSFEKRQFPRYIANLSLLVSEAKDEGGSISIIKRTAEVDEPQILGIAYQGRTFLHPSLGYRVNSFEENVGKYTKEDLEGPKWYRTLSKFWNFD